MNTLRIVAVLALLVHGLLASEEFPLPLRHADVKGMAGEWGEVRIQITTKEMAISAVIIEAFGRRVTLNDKDLAGLKGFLFSRVEITQEGGYRAHGGPVVSFKLSHFPCFEGDPMDGAPLLRETVVIAIQKSGPPTVTRGRAPDQTKPNKSE